MAASTISYAANSNTANTSRQNGSSQKTGSKLPSCCAKPGSSCCVGRDTYECAKICSGKNSSAYSATSKKTASSGKTSTGKNTNNVSSQKTGTQIRNTGQQTFTAANSYKSYSGQSRSVTY
ncbi:MAG: hypothetical protein LBQ54_11330 [Planctomycetaceae bacterium]|nr:hypothetical protein [Planctomycetaceae bacterium]